MLEVDVVEGVGARIEGGLGSAVEMLQAGHLARPEASNHALYNQTQHNAEMAAYE